MLHILVKYSYIGDTQKKFPFCEQVAYFSIN